jgi:hypothetical protein
MVKKIYNVVLQSAIGNGTTTSNETFSYDWSQIPDVPYYVSFSFSSVVTPLTSNNQVACLYVDLSQSYNQIAKPQSTNQPEFQGQFLGNLVYALASANNFLYAENNTNPPTYLGGRPRSNNFTVEIRSLPTVDYTPPLTGWSLILSFQEL